MPSIGRSMNQRAGYLSALQTSGKPKCKYAPLLWGNSEIVFATLKDEVVQRHAGSIVTFSHRTLT